ncbi:MAG: hypothetical protein D6676_11480 [Cyanobacteria bacterium J003]|nr:MAG: hypothetical protein D6676_11480 [Cyanobacteria bacterium J003]
MGFLMGSTAAALLTPPATLGVDIFKFTNGFTFDRPIAGNLETDQWKECHTQASAMVDRRHFPPNLIPLLIVEAMLLF